MDETFDKFDENYCPEDYPYVYTNFSASDRSLFRENGMCCNVVPTRSANQNIVDTCPVGQSTACEDYEVKESIFDGVQHRFENSNQPFFDHKHIGTRKCKDFLIYSKQKSRIDTNHQQVDKLFKNALKQDEDIGNNKLKLYKVDETANVLKVSLFNNSALLMSSTKNLCGCRSLDLGK